MAIRINLNGNGKWDMNSCGIEKDLTEVINIRGVPVPLICWELINDAERAANEAKNEYGYTDRQIQPDDHCYALRGASKQDIESLADRLEQAASSLREIAGYGYYVTGQPDSWLSPIRPSLRTSPYRPSPRRLDTRNGEG